MPSRILFQKAVLVLWLTLSATVGCAGISKALDLRAGVPEHDPELAVERLGRSSNPNGMTIFDPEGFRRWSG